MGYGIIGYSQQNAPWQPSGSVWGDQNGFEAIDEGSGFASFADFVAALPTTAAPNWAIDSGAFTYNASFDHVVSVTTGATTQDDAALATRPIGPITSGGGGKFFFEANVSLASVAAAKGVFVGVANLAALGSKLLISAASATKASNTLGSSAGGQSGYGFWLHGDVLNNFDAVWFNNLQAVATATVVNANTAANNGTVLASVLTANANNPNPANLGYTPALPPGVITATTGTQPNLENGTAQFVKFGLRYDGQQYLYYYVNGAQVGKLAITAAQDQTSHFGGVVQIMAGTGAANVLNVAFIRTASLNVP